MDAAFEKHDSPAIPAPLAVGQMDRGLHLLLTAETALRNVDWRSEDVIEAICHTLELALGILQPVRDLLDDTGLKMKDLENSIQCG